VRQKKHYISNNVAGGVTKIPQSVILWSFLTKSLLGSRWTFLLLSAVTMMMINKLYSYHQSHFHQINTFGFPCFWSALSCMVKS